jgi:hypothetical protein
MENLAIFYGCLDYFSVIWSILWPFGNFVVIWYFYPVLVFLPRLVFYPVVVYCSQKKSGNPAHLYNKFVNFY